MPKFSVAKYGLFLLMFALVTTMVLVPSRFAVQSQSPFTPTPAAALQTIESDALSVIRQGTWLSQNAAQASGRSYLYSSGSSDDSLTLYFSGSSIEIIYVTHPSLGSLAIEIDNAVVRTLFANTDGATYDQRAVINALPEGPHILQVYAVQGVVAVDAFVTRPLQTNSPDPATTQSSSMFIPNEGQYGPEVQFEANGPGLFALYESNRANFFIPVQSNASDDRSDTVDHQEIPFSQVFQGTSATMVVTGINRQPGVVNYLVGNNRAEWHTNLPIYGGVVYHNLYPNTDLYFTDATGLSNGEFILKPGADLSNIRWNYEGVSNLRLDSATGQLAFEIDNTENLEASLLPQRLTMQAWQLSNGQPQTVMIDYVLNTDGSVGLSANNYDATRPLTIQASVAEEEMGTAAASVAFPDLASFSYSTYVGGGAEGRVNDIAVDADGNAYMVGNFVSGIFGQNLRKYSPDGTLVYATLVGDTDALLNSVVVDGMGRPYVTGSTGYLNFPTTPNAYQPTSSHASDCPIFQTICGQEVVVVRLNTAGDNLEYSTYLGGDRNEDAYGIAIRNGHIYLTGFTTSFNDFDITEPPPNFIREKEAFIIKLNPALSGAAQLEFGYIFGGGSQDTDPPPDDNYYFGDYDDYGTAIAVDTAGNVLIGGYTETPDFWASEADVYQSSCITHLFMNLYTNRLQNRCISGFIEKFRPVVGSEDDLILQASTYFGGNGNDIINDIAVDAQGYVYVVGTTGSTSQLFTTSNGYDVSFNGGTTYLTGDERPQGGDAFLAKFAPDLRAQDLVYATYLGGSGGESGYGVAVNAGGIATITGTTSSTDFPLSSNPLQNDLGGISPDVFLTRLDTTTSGSASLIYSTYIGGADNDVGYSVATDNNFAFYVVGETTSTNFPMVNASQPTYGGGAWDGFALRGQSSCGEDTIEISPLPPDDFQSSDLPSWAVHEIDGFSEIAGLSGLYMYEAPAINANFSFSNIALWGEALCINGRLEYHNGGVQIWYRVPGDNGQNYWVLGEVGTHRYIATEDGDIVAALPENQNPPETISFPYNRERAAEYARVRSIENIANPPQIFVDDPQTPDDDRRTAITHDPLFPAYPELTGFLGATGSAIFISQSLWTGGLPMTAYQENCASDNIIGSDGGWRYCPNESRAGSRNWNLHQGIIQYIDTFKAGDANSWDDVAIIAGFPESDVDFALSSDAPLIEPARKFIEENEGATLPGNQTRTGTLSEVQEGDYLYIDSGSATTDNHGFIVVGWGPTQICTSLETEQLVPAYPENPADLLVPYVADYSYGISEEGDPPSWTQYPGPRPFYCLQLDTPLNEFAFTNYFFYEAPSVVEFSPSPAVLNTDRLYAPNFELLTNQN